MRANERIASVRATPGRLGITAVFVAALAVLSTSACSSDDDPGSPAGQGGGAPDAAAGTGGGDKGGSGLGGAAGSEAGGAAGAAGIAGAAGASWGGGAGAAGAAGSAGSGGEAGAAGSGGASPGCSNGSDCQGPQVCDPATLQCVNSACQPPDYESCADHPASICLEQDDSHGACYPACKPFDSSSACSGGAACIVQSDDESLGLCYHPGTAAVGAECEANDTSTGCVDGSVCVNFGSSQAPDRKCVAVCQLFSTGATGCAPTELCMAGSVCLPSDLGFYDQVAIGEECTFGDYLYCGESGGRLTGICDDAPSGGKELRCYGWCRLNLGATGNADCPASYECMDTDWGSGLGVCVASVP